jgi:hypothetical protein
VAQQEKSAFTDSFPFMARKEKKKTIIRVGLLLK